jgi:hypothetical protein
VDITKSITVNAATIELELQWLARMIESAIDMYFNTGNAKSPVIETPDLHKDHSAYAELVKAYKMNDTERLLLILALAPHVRPQLLDTFFIKNTNYDRGFTEFGGVKGIHHSGFIPTGETFVFIAASMNLAKRIALYELFSKEHFFVRNNIIKLNQAGADEPLLSSSLHVSPEYLSRLTSGREYKPEYTTSFPAMLLQTPLTWDDLVLPAPVLEDIDNIIGWIKNEEQILSHGQVNKFIRKGYRALFYGPPGTGKTLTASLMGKETGRDVYRIDLSMIVSKYIGETEKNLATLFDMAENKHWILFFDEADALFGKRSQTKDAHDRYANQEVAYLLQRIEEHPGPILLATNLKNNIDPAFTRRFHAIIQFPAPGARERHRLWQSIFDSSFKLEKAIDFEKLAEEHAVTGGMLVNVLRYCAGKAVHNRKMITLADVREGLNRELHKEGKQL